MSETEKTENKSANEVKWLRVHMWEQETLLDVLGDEKLDGDAGLFKAQMELKLRKKLYEMALLMYEDGRPREEAFQESIECLSDLGLLGFLVFKDELEEKLRPINSGEEIISCLQEGGKK